MSDQKLSMPLAVDREPRPDDIRRFMKRVRMNDESGCWDWTGHKDRKGYGQFRWLGVARWAHRVSYAMFRRPLLGGLTVEHKCRNPGCCNPWHLELLTVEENCHKQASANGHAEVTPF